MGERRLLASILFSALLGSVVVFATSFTFMQQSPTPQAVIFGGINQTFNFTVTNTNGTFNITHVNVTLPSGIVFVDGTNYTSSSSNFVGSPSTVKWYNYTDDGIVYAGSNATFTFKFNVSSSPVFNVVSFTVYTNDTSGGINSTNYSMYITPPVVSDPSGEFGIVQPVVYINWSSTPAYQQNVTVIVNGTKIANITLEVVNATALFLNNYSQASCGSGFVLVENATGYGNVTGPLNGSANYNSINVSMTANASLCAPGKYWIQRLMVRNQTNTAENLNFTVFVDVPVTSSNINASTGTTGFAGTLPANATTYHSYYLNLSAVPNATAVYANLSASAVAHIFLFDESGNLKSKSVDNTATQSLSFGYLTSTPASPWEIRIYGNSTSQITYSGFIVFSSLNVTNSTAGETVSGLSYGTMNVSSRATTNLNLTNKGSLNLGNVSLSSSLYRTQTFSDSGSKNFTFLVGDYSTESKVRVNLTWSGASNYTINVYNPSGTLVASSSNIYLFANVSNASVQELYIDTTSVTSGYWKVAVVANSGSAPFNLTVFAFVNSANNWINASTFTTDALNGLYANTSLQVNLTVPNLTIDGNYKGTITFRDANGGIVDVPVSFTVTTPTLLVLNATPTSTILTPLSSGIFTQGENYGADLTKTINLNLSNIGAFNLSMDMTRNSSLLTCTTPSSCYSNSTNFTYNVTSFILKNSSQLVQVNITFNSSLPLGVYDGWIFINATNNTDANLSSHPYSSYNLTLRLNLTNVINVIVGPITSPEGTNFLGNATYDQNATVNFSLTYLNGTLLSDAEAMAFNTSNFTMWLIENNITNYEIPADVDLLLFNGTNPLYSASTDTFSVNFTVPGGSPGGQYGVNTLAGYRRTDNKTFSGGGSNSSLIINNTGLYPTLITTSSLSLDNGTYATVNVTIKNFGPLNASGVRIKITPPTSYATANEVLGYSCDGVSNQGADPIFSISGYNSGGCYIAWKITATQNNGTGTVWINGTVGEWFRNVSFSLQVNKPTSSQQQQQQQNITLITPANVNVTKGTGTATAKITSVSVGANTVDLGYVDGLYLSKFVINSKSALSNVRLVSTSLASKPSEISPDVVGTVFNYFKVDISNISDTNINNVTISFYVTKSWLTSNNINTSTIKLVRYSNDSWNELSTTKTTESLENVYFDAVSPGFSTFAIAGQPSTQAQQQNITTQNTTADQGNVTATSTDSVISLASTVGLALVVVGTIGVAIYFMTAKKARPAREAIAGTWDDVRKKWAQ